MAGLTADPRKIIHIDMDAFFASVEIRENPSLRGKPVAVGGGGARGVISTASYEARKFGVKSAIATESALKLCPHLILLPVRMRLYQEAAAEIREIFYELTDTVEPVSIDEAYLDVTEVSGYASATEIAARIREEIQKRTKLTATAGVSYNKFLAKMASGVNKPNGMFVIPPHKGPDFVKGTEVRELHGIGPATARKMAEMGIITGSDLLAFSRDRLKEVFGKSGEAYYLMARGIDHRPVETHRERKSVGAENTFTDDITNLSEASVALERIADELWARKERNDFEGRTLTLKLKYADFQQASRSKTLTRPVQSRAEALEMARSLLRESFDETRGVRLLGISISGSQKDKAEDDKQMSLF